MVIIVLVWLLCSVYATGTAYAMFQDMSSLTPRRTQIDIEQDYRQDLGFALLLGLVGGPVAAVMAFFFSGFNVFGWGPWRKTRSNQ